jgi:(p)ppGpp synthase/HD superfamily hydrolase
MNDIVTIMKAADFAARKHTRQKRKGEEAEPYLNHLIEVASLVAEATDGRPEVVIAALLHDAVEDQATNDEIAALFGSTVASFVSEVTDDKSLPKEERKAKQIARAPHKSPEASVIKLADKTSNLLAIAKSPPPWPIERKRAYVEWAKAVVSQLPFKPTGLLTRFEAAVKLASESIEQQV